jgi:hypothetical protein
MACLLSQTTKYTLQQAQQKAQQNGEELQCSAILLRTVAPQQTPYTTKIFLISLSSTRLSSSSLFLPSSPSKLSQSVQHRLLLQVYQRRLIISLESRPSLQISRQNLPGLVPNRSLCRQNLPSIEQIQRPLAVPEQKTAGVQRNPGLLIEQQIWVPMKSGYPRNSRLLAPTVRTRRTHLCLPTHALRGR